MKKHFLKTIVCLAVIAVMVMGISMVVSAEDASASSNCGEVRYFTVKINTEQKTLPNQWPDPTYDTTNTIDWECVLKLPTNYSEDGDPVPLIMRCHGYGGYVTDSCWRGNEMEQFTTNGFAVFDVDNIRGVNEAVPDVGIPAVVRAYMRAYDHIIANYNVQPKMIAIGVSFGSYPALEIMDYYPEHVRAGVLGGVRTSIQYAHISWSYLMGSGYGFPSPNTYDEKIANLYDYYGNVKTVNGKKYLDKRIPPTFWAFANSEKSDGTCWERAMDVVEGLKNSGNQVTDVYYDGLNHGQVCSFTDTASGLRGDTLEWLSQYKTITCTHTNTASDDPIAATCTVHGYTGSTYCTDCYYVTAGRDVVAKTGHSEAILPAVDATCQETGLTEGKYCDECGEVITAQKVVPFGAHSLNSVNQCTVCGYVEEDIYYTDALRSDKQQLFLDETSYVAGEFVNSVLAFGSASATATLADAVADPDSIVALSVGETVESVNINADKLGNDKNYLIVYYGGLNGTMRKSVISLQTLSSIEIYMPNALEVVKELEVDGVKYTNLIATTYSMSANDILKYRTIGANFKIAGSQHANPMAVDFGAKFSGEGQYSIMVGFAGVPASDLGKTFEATPIIQVFAASAAQTVTE